MSALAVVVVAIGATVLVTAPAGAAGISFRHCGTLPGPGAKFSIFAHQARCRLARHVFSQLFAGRGRRRRDPGTGKIDRVIDGWICGSATGGFQCAKLGPGGKPMPFDPNHIGPTIDAVGQ